MKKTGQLRRIIEMNAMLVKREVLKPIPNQKRIDTMIEREKRWYPLLVELEKDSPFFEIQNLMLHIRLCL